MSYEETLDFLYSRLPVFHLVGAKAFKPGLETTIWLCGENGDPQLRFPSVHVGGTNGKGSTSHALASVLMEAGYKVGLYTSPHLKSFTERIKVNGNEIDKDFVVKFIDDNLFNIDKFEPSFFELTVVMAFSYFAKERVDIAVIEVGMGGRLDSTNVIMPVLSVITNVSFDHVQYLGDSLTKIAWEKAGIIKHNIPVVISEFQDREIADVFEQKAQDMESEISFASNTYSVISSSYSKGFLELGVSRSDVLEYNHLRLDLSGAYQLKNVCGILASVDVLRRNGYLIDKKDIYAGLSKVVGNTGLKGRWQLLRSSPSVYCDTAHNVAGLTDTLQQFGDLQSTSKRFVIGFVNDKDVSSILDLFPVDGIFYFCEPSNARALKATNLASIALVKGLVGRIIPDVNRALETAILESDDTDSIYVGGSTFVVADLNNL
jgi:dihydrofolate synthase / folylpolyglutamate synthase